MLLEWLRKRAALLLKLVPPGGTAPSNPVGAPSRQHAGGGTDGAGIGNRDIQGEMLTRGVSLMGAKRHEEAIHMYFEPVVTHYEKRNSQSNLKVFSSRSQIETAHYLVQELKSGQQRRAIAVSSNYAMAHFLKGYALLELGRSEEAKIAVLRAVELAPQNAGILNELGHIYQLQKDFTSALATFTRAESAAAMFSPPDVRTKELTRAWRGVGHTLIEMNRLDEATAYYLKCLELNPGDRTAPSELLYIELLKARAR